MIENFLLSEEVYWVSAFLNVVLWVLYRVFYEKLKVYEIIIASIFAFCPLFNVAIIGVILVFLLYIILEDIFNKEL